MHKTFVTFGWGHSHTINNHVFDRDCVAVINAPAAKEGMKVVQQLFGNRYSFAFPQENWSGEMHYPGGYRMAYGECWAPGSCRCTCPGCQGNSKQ